MTRAWPRVARLMFRVSFASRADDIDDGDRQRPQVLEGGSEEERAQLIAKRLREWKSAANAF